MNRDQLNAEFNKLAARAAELRTADESADELVNVTAAMRSIESELAVIAARDAAPAKVEIVSTAPESIGAAAVRAGLKTANRDQAVTVERDIFTDPFGGEGAQPSAPTQYTPGIAALPTLPTSILDLMPVVPTSSDSVSYYRQTGFASAVGLTGVLSPYAQSEVTWEKVVTPVSKLGHSMVVAEETLADDSAVAALLNREGVRGVRESVEGFVIEALLVGANSVEDQGDLATTIRKAKTAAEVAGLPADTVIVTPQVREQLDLEALPANGGQGIYGNGVATIFGMRVVTSYRLTGTDILVGSTQATRLRSRQGIEVSSSNSHDGLFLKDGVAIKARTRVAVEVVFPESWVKVTEALAS
jgi:HK97 family phage major capsid protein